MRLPSLVTTVALMSAGLLSACASLSGQAQQPDSMTFSETRLMQDIRTLSDDSYQGRGIATEGETMTVRYLIDQYQAAGFGPGGENGGWTQDVTLNRFTASNIHGLHFQVGGDTVVLNQGQDIVVSTRLPGSHVMLDHTPMVFVGYGIKAPERNWDDFKGMDLRGKVLVVLVNDADFEDPSLDTFGGRTMTYYGRWTYKFEEAARQGAAGMIIVHETAPASYGWATVNNSWSGPQFDIVRENAAAERIPMEAWIQRDVAVDLFRRAGLDFEQLKAQARTRDFRPVELGDATFSGMFDVSTSQVVTRNVIARLDGTTHPDESILYTGHWDHIGVGDADANGDAIFNGAVDNASGTAGLLELARHFSQAQRPQRSIVMISFTAEESGLLGSEYYAANPTVALEKVVAGFNIDAMNVYGRVQHLGIVGYGQSYLDELLTNSAARQGRTVTPDENPAAGSYFRSDHFPLAKRGVPMAYAEGGGDFRDAPTADRDALRAEYGTRRYHQADDEIQPGWDLRGMIEDLQVIYWIGQDLANSRIWPEWKPTSEFRHIREASASARR